MQVVDQVIRLVRQIAQTEVMPRFLRVGVSRKQDGTPFTEADLASQAALSRTLPAILPCPVLGEEMNPAEQQALWDQAWHDGIWVVDLSTARPTLSMDCRTLPSRSPGCAKGAPSWE